MSAVTSGARQCVSSLSTLVGCLLGVHCSQRPSLGEAQGTCFQGIVTAVQAGSEVKAAPMEELRQWRAVQACPMGPIPCPDDQLLHSPPLGERQSGATQHIYSILNS